MRAKIQKGIHWYSSNKPIQDKHFTYLSRDIFQARLDHFYKELINKKISQADAALITAIAGEIGNNCFDHNLGQWKDMPGCYFHYGFDETFWFLITDRGQGILSSLKKIIPDLQNDQQALKIAFSKKISGRSPEKRGNGLKFVKSVINGNKNRWLLFSSGHGFISFGKINKLQVELDFTGVKVLTPSWIDEFLTGLKQQFKNRVICLPSNNPSVIESLKIIE